MLDVQRAVDQRRRRGRRSTAGLGLRERRIGQHHARIASAIIATTDDSRYRRRHAEHHPRRPAASIDVSSGGYVGANGQLKLGSDGLPVGKGGNLSLLTYTVGWVDAQSD